MLRKSTPSGSNGSDTNFGPIAIKGPGHETATMVNGETVHQAGAPVLFTSTSFLPLPVNQPSQSHFLWQKKQRGSQFCIFKYKLCILCSKESLQFAVAGDATIRGLATK